MWLFKPRRVHGSLLSEGYRVSCLVTNNLCRIVFLFPDEEYTLEEFLKLLETDIDRARTGKGGLSFYMWIRLPWQTRLPVFWKLQTDMDMMIYLCMFQYSLWPLRCSSNSSAMRTIWGKPVKYQIEIKMAAHTAFGLIQKQTRRSFFNKKALLGAQGYSWHKFSSKVFKW